MDWTTVHVLLVIFLATTIRSGFGFGEALIAVPLLALVMPVEVASPLAALMSVTIALIAVVQDWQKIHVRSAVGLVVSTLFGIPLGLWLIVAVREDIVKAILGTFIIAFSSFCLVRKGGLVLHDDRLAWIFGFAAGIFGGAYSMNGPPLVIYGTLRRWSAEHFRATLQGYFLPASLVGLGGYWLGGLMQPDVWHYYLVSLPAALVAIFVGRWLNRRLSGPSFIIYVHVGLIVLGSGLLILSVWK